MSHVTRGVLAVLLALLSFVTAQPASDGPATCDDRLNACDIVVTVPGDKVANDRGKRVPPS